MTDFIEHRLNDGLYCYDTVGGPEWSTAVIAVASGAERRNRRWSEMRGRWELGERSVTQTELDALLDFHAAVRGRAIGFRLRVHGDYEVPATRGVLAPATGVTAHTYDLYHRRGIAGHTHDRRIHKPVEVTVYDGGLPVSGVVVDTVLGRVTLPGAPSGALSWSGTFDTPVRFDSDQLRYRYMAEQPGDGRLRLFWLYSLPVVEIRP